MLCFSRLMAWHRLLLAFVSFWKTRSVCIFICTCFLPSKLYGKFSPRAFISKDCFENSGGPPVAFAYLLIVGGPPEQICMWMMVFCVTIQRKDGSWWVKCLPEWKNFVQGGFEIEQIRRTSAYSLREWTETFKPHTNAHTRCVMPKGTNVSEGEMKKRWCEEEKGKHAWVVGVLDVIRPPW